MGWCIYMHSKHQTRPSDRTGKTHVNVGGSAVGKAAAPRHCCLSWRISWGSGRWQGPSGAGNQPGPIRGGVARMTPCPWAWKPNHVYNAKRGC